MEKSAKPDKKPRRKNWLVRIAFILLIAFTAIQFMQPGKNNQHMDMQHDISMVIHVPDTVQTLLRTACYDCHSNFTQYPWYSSIQPIGWWLKNHIDEGKSHLNFQEFALVKANDRYKTVALRQDHKLDEIGESIREGWMPLESYLWTHGNAKFSEAERRLLLQWVDSARAELSGH